MNRESNYMFIIKYFKFSYFKDYGWVLRYLPHIIYFNFKFLPFSQAIKLPIWLYKPKFGCLRGGVIMDMPLGKIRPGMVQLGIYGVNLYPNNGCFIDISGRIVFKGKCKIGNCSYITVAESGLLEFGDNFYSTTSLKIVCYNSVVFGRDVLIGWDCLFMDTDFHSLTRVDGTKTKGYGTIRIGDSVWFGTGCKIFKRTVIPSKCVVSAQTIISEPVEAQECSIIGTNREIIVKARGYYRNVNDDYIDYYNYNEQ